MKELNPPAIVQQEEESTEQLMNSIREDLTPLLKAGNDWVYYRGRAGLKLLRLKKRLPHGQWLASLQQLGIHERAARRWMAKAGDKDQIGHLSDLDDAVSSSDEKDSSAEIEKSETKLQSPCQPTQVESRLCRSCRLNGPKTNCPDCKALNPKEREPGDDTEIEEAQKATSKASKNGKKAEAKPDEKAAADKPKDALGHALPVHLIPAFAAVERFEEIDSALRKIQKDTDELVRGPGGEQLARCVKAHGNDEKLSYRLEELEAVKRHVKFTRPYSVCPFCSGDGNKSCKGCAGAGWVTKTTWDGTDEKTRGRLK